MLYFSNSFEGARLHITKTFNEKQNYLKYNKMYVIIERRTFCMLQ